jgi:hypothetical protein
MILKGLATPKFGGLHYAQSSPANAIGAVWPTDQGLCALIGGAGPNSRILLCRPVRFLLDLYKDSYTAAYYRRLASPKQQRGRWLRRSLSVDLEFLAGG